MSNEIDALLQETRSFPPSDDFRRNANANDESVYDVADREAYWASWAEQLDWQTKWHTVLEWNAPYAKWFVGGKLNASDENPPKTTECAAPIRAQASMAIAASGTIGM